MNYEGDYFNSELTGGAVSGDVSSSVDTGNSPYVSDHNQLNFIPLAISFVLGIIIGVLLVILFRPKK